VQTLQDLFAYNTWADARVFAVCREVDRAFLGAQATGTFGTIEDTLKHLVSVEDVYTRMLGDEPPEAMGPFEAYLSHDLAWFEERAKQLGAHYAALLANASADYLAAPLKVPWFDFPVTKHDGLLQVLSHSAQHRAQAFSVLGERGVVVPDLDYIIFVKHRAGK